MNRWSPLRVPAQVAAIVAAGTWVYWPALQGGWVWDDGLEIGDNPGIKQGSIAALWTAPAGPDYLPLKSTVQWIEWHLWGGHTVGYHAVNLALHLTSAFLLWRLLGKWKVRCAWLAGLLFAVHPVAVSSVAWIAELKNTLALPPLILAMGAWIDVNRSDQARDLARCCGWFLVSMLCKGSGVMFPCIALLYSLWARGRLAARDARPGGMLLGISLAFGFATLRFQATRALAGATAPLPPMGARIAHFVPSLAFYLGHAFWPTPLAPIYPPWPPIAALGAALACAAIILFWSRRKTWGRTGLLALGIFAINLLPVLGLLPMAYLHVSWTADHLAYLSLAGLAAFAAVAVSTAGRAGSISLAAICVIFAVEARSYARIYTDDRTFWSYAVQANPRAWMAQASLGLLDYRDGRISDAIGHLKEAARLEPRMSKVQGDLANAFARAGRLDEAEAHYRAGLALDPGDANLHKNLARVLVHEGIDLGNAGRLAEAKARFEAALEADPSSAPARQNLETARQALAW